MPAQRNDPLLSFRFRVEIGDEDAGGFSEVSGLQADVDVFEYREGGMNDHVHKLAGIARYPSNLILKHGMMSARPIWLWEREIAQGRIQRRQVSIILMDAAGADKWRWDFDKAYPVRWSGPDLRASSSEVAIETMELAHAGLISSSGPE